MKRKRYKRRRIIIAYILRALLFVTLMGMLFLMVCGCLYLHDLFRPKESLETNNNLLDTSNIKDEIEKDINLYEDDSYVSGLECYYCPDAEDGKRIAENIVNVLGKSENIIVRNAKPEEYYVLKHTNMAAILLELGYLSNYEERQKLSDENYQKMLSQEIAKGIMSYFE